MNMTGHQPYKHRMNQRRAVVVAARKNGEAVETTKTNTLPFRVTYRCGSVAVRDDAETTAGCPLCGACVPYSVKRVTRDEAQSPSFWVLVWSDRYHHDKTKTGGRCVTGGPYDDDDLAAWRAAELQVAGFDVEPEDDVTRRLDVDDAREAIRVATYVTRRLDVEDAREAIRVATYGKDPLADLRDAACECRPRPPIGVDHAAQHDCDVETYEEAVRAITERDRRRSER